MNFDQICRRAGGRRAYNKRRRLAQGERILLIFTLLRHISFFSSRDLSVILGVSEATISRDRAFIERHEDDLWPLSQDEMARLRFSWLTGDGQYQTLGPALARARDVIEKYRSPEILQLLRYL